MSNRDKSKFAKIGLTVFLFEILFLVFLGLKFAGIVTWPWWIVSAPLWLPMVLGVSIVLLGGMLLFFTGD